MHVNNRHVYPDLTFEPRTSESYASSLETLTEGVKGPSVLNDLLVIPDNVAIDYMHQTLEGVINTLIGIYMKKRMLNIECVESMRKDLFVPNCFRRRARSLNLVSFWKATEYKFFLLYSGPIITFLSLSHKGFTHFNMLYSCLYMLLSPISHHQLHVVEDGLRAFVDFHSKALVESYQNAAKLPKINVRA